MEDNRRVVIVTGGSRGIGREIALEFARNGCNVVIVARGDEELQGAARQLESAAGAPDRVLAVTADLADHAAAGKIVTAATGKWGSIDVVVNNVGGNRRKPFEQTTDADWQDLLELNLLSGVRLTRAALPHMRERRHASVLFISSIWGREAGAAELTLYVTTKAAMIALSKALAVELAPLGIRSNVIAPGSILFPGGGWERRLQADPEAITAFVEQEMPLGRFGTPAEVAALAFFLASPQASLITGACIPADGAQGRTLI
jgi:3-oxoacyl-[acyl-carrier protein] reductase